MKARKTIRAKILELWKSKEELLRHEYENWQRYLHGNKSVPLYSATKQQADRLLRRLKGKLKPNKEYPMILRKDVYRANTKLTPYWLKIPVYGIRGGINVPIRTHEPITEDMICKEAKIVRKGDEWFVYITVEKEIEERSPNSLSNRLRYSMDSNNGKLM